MNALQKIQNELENVDKNSRLATKYDYFLPKMADVHSVAMDILAVIFPGYFHAERETSLASIAVRLERQIDIAVKFSNLGAKLMSSEVTEKFMESLPSVKRLLLTDIEAFYEGDPAAKYREEVILCYPGFFAIAIYRLAHVLYRLNVPLIPRMMSEFAHSDTGVDIHPGAEIGEYFFIDHATGTVIGETTVIGNHVKLYQGVTLGAKSFELDESGKPVKDIKRHPNIGNHVVIYANATILGGNTHIGDKSIIGANTWIVESVPEKSRIFYSADVAKAEQFWGDNGSGI